MTYTPQHTYEEYKAWGEERVKVIDKMLSPFAFTDDTLTAILVYYRASLLANLDTLERHKETAPLSWLCGGCGFYFEGDLVSEFPCPTYTDIANRLDQVMSQS